MKFLIDSKDDLELHTLLNEINLKQKDMKDRAKWLTKQLSEIMEEKDAINKAYWKKAKKRLNELDLLKDYDDDENCLEVDGDTGQVFMKKKSEEEGIGSLLSALMRGR